VTLRHRDRLDGVHPVEVAFTDRGLDVGDRADPRTRAAALAAVADATGARPVLMHQVHGAHVVMVDGSAGAGPPDADGLLTTRPGIALLARAADCLPVLLADPDAGVVAAVHAGRAGLAAGVVPAAVAAAREAGAGRITAWIGPSVCGACYEVPDALRSQVAAVVPEAWSVTSWDTPALDLAAGARTQLAAAGVDAVHEVAGCTLEDDAWPSHRRDGEGAGRFAGLVWMVR
jgi:YfiH family protein